MSAITLLQKAQTPYWHTFPSKVLQIAKRTAISFAVPFASFPIIPLLPSARAALSGRVVQFSETYLATPLRDSRTYLSSLLPSMHTTFQYGLKTKVNWTTVLVGSSYEEIFFRSFIQTILLTDLPRLITRKIAPSYEPWIDHTMAKVTRNVLTSSLFALSHMIRFGNVPGMLLSQFLGGVYFSYLREQGTSIAELSSIHFTWNAVCILLQGGVEGGLD